MYRCMGSCIKASLLFNISMTPLNFSGGCAYTIVIPLAYYSIGRLFHRYIILIDERGKKAIFISRSFLKYPRDSDGTKPGFGFECFKTFKLFQGKQKSSNHKWLVSNLFFHETFWGNGGEKGREVALFFKLHEAEVIFFSPPLLPQPS